MHCYLPLIVGRDPEVHDSSAAHSIGWDFDATETMIRLIQKAWLSEGLVYFLPLLHRERNLFLHLTSLCRKLAAACSDSYIRFK